MTLIGLIQTCVANGWPPEFFIGNTVAACGLWHGCLVCLDRVLRHEVFSHAYLAGLGKDAAECGGLACLFWLSWQTGQPQGLLEVPDLPTLLHAMTDTTPSAGILFLPPTHHAFLA